MRIAFIRKGPWPAANTSAIQALQLAFPQAEIVILDLIEQLRHHRGLKALNALWIAKEYGSAVLTQRRSVREAFWITSLMFQALRRLINKQVKGHGYSFSFQMQSLFDASTVGTPHYVYTDHTVWANRLYPGFRGSDLYAPAWMQREREIYDHAERIFTRSHNISRSLVDDYGCAATKIHCVHVGCNVPAPPTMKHAPQIPQVLFVGIDWQRKGGPELAAAWPQVLKHHPQAQLLIIGCRPQLTLPQTHIPGRLPLDAVSQFYQQSTLFCLPTRQEPFGVAVIEAMAHALPVITTNIGALPEVVEHGHTGWLVEPGSTAQLAWRINQLLADPQRCYSFGQAGARRAQQWYSWEYVASQLASYIQI